MDFADMGSSGAGPLRSRGESQTLKELPHPQVLFTLGLLNLQPAPTTATRSAVGTGFCMLMISLTLVAATGVRLIIISLGLRSRNPPRGTLLPQYNTAPFGAKRAFQSFTSPLLECGGSPPLLRRKHPPPQMPSLGSPNNLHRGCFGLTGCRKSRFFGRPGRRLSRPGREPW